MNTFLPYADFESSAACLDNKRLGKQRLECYQLLMLTIDPTKTGWRRHPAAMMWHNHETSLVGYFLFCCIEWKRRGFRDTLTQSLIDAVRRAIDHVEHCTVSGIVNAKNVRLMIAFDRTLELNFNEDYSESLRTLMNRRNHPAWIDHPASISGFRSNLLRKDPKHYGQFGWTENSDLDYFWGGLLALKKLLGKNYSHYDLTSITEASPNCLPTSNESEVTVSFKLDFVQNGYFLYYVDSNLVEYVTNDEVPTDFSMLSPERFNDALKILRGCSNERTD